MGHYSHSDIEEAVKSAKKEGLKDYLYQEPHGKKRSHKKSHRTHKKSRS
ncbi:CotG/ExsB N-terminal domain-containing protein, partial [Bacillus subtilis]